MNYGTLAEAGREAGKIESLGRVQAFVNWNVIAKGQHLEGANHEALETFKARWPRSVHLETIQKSIQKAAVLPMDSVGGSTNSLTTPSVFGQEFINYIRPRTILGRLEGKRTIPLNTRVGRTTQGAVVGWTGQGVASVATTLGFDNILMKQAKITGIVVLTQELAKLGDPSAEALIREDLADATAQFMDQQLLDPNVAEVTDVSPASITNGATEIASTGATLSAISADLSALLALITTNFTNVYLIMKPTTALGISKLSSGSGGAAFPNLGAYGGSIWGVPVIVSDNVPSDANSPSDRMIVAVDASEILFNDGGIELEASRNAAIEMNTSPDSPRTASTVLVSMYQSNLIAVLVRRYVNWKRRREGSVAILTGVPF